MKPVAILSAARTPIGRFLGSFADVPARDLGVTAAKAALERAGVDAQEIGETVFGMARQAGNGPNPARQVGLGAGVPQESPAVTINQACASGLKAISLGAAALEEGDSRLVLVGGMDNDPQFMFADHLAFRVDGIDAVRAVKARLEEAGVEGVAPVSHGNAWSVYFTDPEGNGIECFTDTPFHVAQPYLEGLPIEMSNDEILEHTRAELAGKPEFQPIEEYRAAMEAKLTAEGR